MITAEAKSQAKKFSPLVILLSTMLLLAACKLTNYNPGTTTTPPTGNTEYLFATSNNQVWSFAVNSTTGALSAGTSVTGPQLSEGIVANPAGTFLYVSDAYNDQVDVFAISATGTLSPVGSPYTVGSVPANNTTIVAATGLAMDPTGSFLYVTDFNNNAVAAFTANGSTGALTAIANSPFAAGTNPQNVVVDPSGKFAYVTDFGDLDGGVFGFTLSSGALTPVAGDSPFDTILRGEPAGAATTPGYIYVTEQASGEVVGLALASGSGLLSPVPNSPITTGGSRPTGVVVTPSGKFLYVANNGNGNAATASSISAYSIDSTSGTLTAITNSPFTTTVSPFYLAVDPSGSFLYASNLADGTISAFSINSSGALTPLSGSATAVGTRPVSLTVVTIP